MTANKPLCDTGSMRRVKGKFSDQELDQRRPMTIRQAAALLGSKGFEARVKKDGIEAVRENACRALESAREKRWAI